jgi:hypothetical protein
MEAGPVLWAPPTGAYAKFWHIRTHDNYIINIEGVPLGVKVKANE